MKKPPLLATILAVAALAVLCALGVWQLDRLGWKQGLLKEIAQQSAAAATALTAQDIADAAKAGKNFLRGSVEGEYVQDSSFLIRPRILDGKQGAHLLTPLRLDDATVLLVNRGWVPFDETKKYPAPEGITAIEGWMRIPDKPNAFTPPNNPAGKEWYGIDAAAISETYDLQGLLPFVMYAETGGLNNNEFPVPLSGKPDLNNNHLSYAVFWFSMACALLIVFILRFAVIKE